MEVKCDICQDMGFVSPIVPVDHPAFGKAVICPTCGGGEALQRHRAAAWGRLSDLMRGAGLVQTERYSDRLWRDFTHDQLGNLYAGKGVAIQLAKKWALGDPISYEDGGPAFAEQYPTTFRFTPGHALWLYGAPGTGKTALAHLAFQERKERTGANGIFVEWTALYNAIKGQYAHEGDANQSYPLLDAMATVPILLLDDIGHQRVNMPVAPVRDDEYNKFWHVIDTRYRRQLPTLLTSNLNRFEMQDRFDYSVVSRLTEMAVICEMGGADLRVWGGEVAPYTAATMRGTEGP
jgi:predicted ATPase